QQLAEALPCVLAIQFAQENAVAALRLGPEAELPAAGVWVQHRPDRYRFVAVYLLYESLHIEQRDPRVGLPRGLHGEIADDVAGALTDQRGSEGEDVTRRLFDYDAFAGLVAELLDQGCAQRVEQTAILQQALRGQFGERTRPAWRRRSWRNLGDSRERAGIRGGIELLR